MLKKLTYEIISIIILLFLILFNSILVLNSTFIFKLYMIKSNIPSQLSIPLENILADYNSIITYLRHPFADKLSFEHFTLSNSGEFHFFEVKKIFLFIYLFLFLTFIFFIILFIKKRALLKSSLKYLNFTAPLFFTILSISFIIDFDYVFTLFHKLFFNNDYWIFNSITDSIITVLPESFFMINAIIILFLIIIEVISFNLFID